MPDENITNQNETPQPAPEADSGQNLESDLPRQFDLAEDLEQLEKLNLIKAVILQFQGGKHPVAEIDALLKRRMNMDMETFQGPYAVRLICTLMMIFLLSSVCWAFLWLFATALEWNGFIRVLSTGIATMLAAVAGIAIFHPASLPDEKLLKEAIAARLDSLREELRRQQSMASEISEQEKAPEDVLKTEDSKGAAVNGADDGV